MLPSSKTVVPYDTWYQELKNALNNMHRVQLMWVSHMAVRTHLFSIDASILY